MFLTKSSTQNPMSQLVFTARELWKIPKTNFLNYHYSKLTRGHGRIIESVVSLFRIHFWNWWTQYFWLEVMRLSLLKPPWLWGSIVWILVQKRTSSDTTSKIIIKRHKIMKLFEFAAGLCFVNCKYKRISDIYTYLLWNFEKFRRAGVC